MSENLKEFDESKLDSVMAGSSRPVLVDFWAPWCGPCKALTPTIEKLADEYAGRVDFGKLDIQSHSGAAAKAHIKSIPTLMIFNNGEVVDVILGKVSEDKIREKLDAALG